MTNLEQLKQRRPGRRDVVEAHKERMIAESRAWRLRELREPAAIRRPSCSRPG